MHVLAGSRASQTYQLIIPRLLFSFAPSFTLLMCQRDCGGCGAGPISHCAVELRESDTARARRHTLNPIHISHHTHVAAAITRVATRCLHQEDVPFPRDLRDVAALLTPCLPTPPSPPLGDHTRNPPSQATAPPLPSLASYFINCHSAGGLKSARKALPESSYILQFTCQLLSRLC